MSLSLEEQIGDPDKYHEECAIWVANQRAWENVPHSEVAFLRQVASPRLTDTEIRLFLAIHRRCNRVCECCRDKSDIHKLQACPGCKILHYCSNTCRDKHWTDGHKDECCNLDAPRASGPSVIVIHNSITGETIY